MKTALITGASGGIGAACAEFLAADGWQVILHYHTNREKAEQLAEKLGGTAIGADLSVPAEIEAMLLSIPEPELVVCSAGIAWTGVLQSMSEEAWNRIFAVNTDSLFHLCRQVLPGMIRRRSGNIITVSSMWGIAGASCEVAYSASKAAVIGFTKALAKEVAPSKIRVNCVAPGVIATPMNSHLSAEELARLAEDTPLGRLGIPEDVAEAVRFLASDASSFITGQVLSVDGGFIL